MAKDLLVVFVGGGLGSVLRLGVSHWTAEKWGASFPWGTLCVNATGSAAIGLIAGLALAEGTFAIPPLARQFLMIGVLGGYTTFSSFSLQTLQLAQEGQWAYAAANVAGSLALCFLSVWAGWMAAQVLQHMR
jgi:CrcB protein